MQRIPMVLWIIAQYESGVGTAIWGMACLKVVLELAVGCPREMFVVKDMQSTLVMFAFLEPGF